MKQWIKTLGLMIGGFGAISIFFGDYSRAIEAERSALYISLFMVILGLIIQAIAWLQDRKKTKAKSISD